MKVTLDVKEVTKQGEAEKKWFGLKQGKPVEYQMHAVILSIQLTNEERAIINKYNLRKETIDIVKMEDDALKVEGYNYHVREYNKTNNAYEETHHKEQMAQYMQPVYYKMDYYLQQPCEKLFRTPSDANVWANRLKTTALPMIKALILQNSGSGGTETFEL